MPQPEKNCGRIKLSATSAARSGRAMPVNKTWPALDERTRHGSLLPSSAMA
jgi:hypothetical protein